MIFVTVGNATQGFRRLLDAVEARISENLFNGEPIFFQTGHNPDFNPGTNEYKPFLSMDEFHVWMEKADLVITHGGSGTILTALRLGKKPIVMPRRKRYGEHVNDHQIQLVQALVKERLIIPAYRPDDLPSAIEEALRRNRQPVSAPQSQIMQDLVSKAIEELTDRKE